jgi:hypothetical protein
VIRPLLADAILVAHAAFVLFVVGGLAAIWIGVALKRRFAFNRTFRIAHLAAIAFVTLETLLGFMCPLTVWEAGLRGESAGGPGFIQRWIHAWMYYDVPAWAFAPVYAVFLALVVATWWRFPPRRQPPA